MDRRLLVLAVGMFALGTDSFVVAGVLPQISHTFAVSIGAAGQTATIYAITYALLAATIAALAAGVPRKSLLLWSLALFVVAISRPRWLRHPVSRWQRACWQASARRCSRPRRQELPRCSSRLSGEASRCRWWPPGTPAQPRSVPQSGSHWQLWRLALDDGVCRRHCRGSRDRCLDDAAEMPLPPRSA